MGRKAVTSIFAVLVVLVSVTPARAAQASVEYASYIGADGRNTAEKIATDAEGNIYVTGWVEGTNLPTPDGSPVELRGGIDVYVMKIAPDGRVLYTTVFGGSENDLVRGLAVDAEGIAYAAGATYSPNFPLVNKVLATNVGAGAAFVTKLNQDGEIVYSDFIGGNNFIGANDIAVDPSGGVYVGGHAIATDLPVSAGAFQPSKHGPLDGWVTKIKSDLSGIAYSTYFGGGAHPAAGFTSNYDEIYALAVDSTGSAFVAGVTDAVDFPTTAGAAQTLPGGQRDAFVAKLTPDGRALVYSTRVGGVGDDQASAMTIDASGAAYLAGRTASPNFPTSNAPQAIPGSVTDAFVTKVNPAGSAIVYSTFIGGSGADYGYGVSVDANGSATIVGQTASANFPSSGGFQTTMKGTADGFITRLSPSGNAIDFSTFIGGSDWDGMTGVQATPAGALVSGFMYSSDMPTTAVTQPSYGGAPYDGYVAFIGVS